VRGFGAGIAPRVTAAVVRADASEARYAGLHQRPVEREIAEPVFDYDRRPPTTSAVHMKFMAAQIHQFSRRCRQGSQGHGRAADNEEWKYPNHWAEEVYESTGLPVRSFSSLRLVSHLRGGRLPRTGTGGRSQLIKTMNWPNSRLRHGSSSFGASHIF
jgi:hypothetical protein